MPGASTVSSFWRRMGREFDLQLKVGHWIRLAISRTGRRYTIKLEALDDESLRELQRLLRDLDHEKQMAVRQARLHPWRR
jgi:hypothetical protein